MTVIGIDCGVEGALALMETDGTLLRLDDMPTRDVRVNGTMRPRIVPALLADLLRKLAPGQAVVEMINPRPGDGARAGELLRAWGQVDGVLGALGIAHHSVDPRRWRGGMGVVIRGPLNTHEGRKKASQFMALRLFPGFGEALSHKEHGSDRAEAALIASWGLRFGGLGQLARAA